MEHRRRWLVSIIFPGLLVAGCGSPVAGEPTGQAGFGHPTPSAQVGTPSTGSSAAPGGIATPRKPAGVDTCALITPAELDPIGGATGDPRRNEMLPESCTYALGHGAPQDSAVVGFFKPFEQARQQQPKGWQESTDGNATWLNCQTDNGYQTCSATIAIQPDRSLVTIISKRDTSQNTVMQSLQTVATAALHRLPTG